MGVLGGHLSQEHKEKLRIALTGKKRGHYSEEHRKKISATLLGRKNGPHSEETRRKIGLGNLGKKLPESTKEKLRLANLGKKASLVTRRKMSLNSGARGPRNANWKGGVTPIYEQIRKSVEYKLWREAVFERDGYACVWCFRKGGRFKGEALVVLNADHIKPFAHYPELRFAIDNGRTLCVPCHQKTDTYGGRKKPVMPVK